MFCFNNTSKDYTPEEIEEKQRKLFEKLKQEEQDEESLRDAEAEAAAYWEDYKINWINHNKQVLDGEYENWVRQNVQYNIENQIEGAATEAEVFKAQFTAESFYESQYNVFIQATYGTGDQPQPE